MSLNEQFEHGRIPLKPLAFENKDLAQKREFLIDYTGEHPSYHLYIVDPATGDIIDITSYMVKEAFGSSITVSIEGREAPITLHDVINFIYKRFTYPNDPNGFNYARDRDKVTDPKTNVVLLQDVDDCYYLPVTRADAVFDDNGNTIQERLDSIVRLGFSNDYIQVAVEDQQVFEITYPFLNYPAGGNYMELRVGTTFIDKTRYQIIDNEDEDGNIYGATITFFQDKFEIGRRIDILYIYNATGALAGNSAINGGQIANNSIPITKLEKAIDSYLIPDSTSLATSKAVYDLYTEFSEAINDAANSNFYLYDYSDDHDIIEVNLNAHNVFLSSKLVMLHILTKTSKNSNITLKVMHGDSQYQNIVEYKNLKIQGGLAENRMVKFLINITDAKYLSGVGEKITASRFIYTCDDQEIEIPFKGLPYDNNSRILVYRNGVRLFDALDYTMDMTKETIRLFVRTEEGERIVFEAENLVF